MPVALNEILRVTAKMSWGLQDIQNTYHIRVDSASADSDATILGYIATELDNDYTNFAAALHTGLSFDTISCYNLTAERFMGEVAWPVLTAGTEGNDPLPAQVAPLVRFATAVLGSQGRKFLGVITTASLDADGTITSSLSNGMTLYAAALLNGVGGGAFSGSFGNYNSTLDRFTVWTTAFVNQYCCTQRRRRPGVGS